MQELAQPENFRKFCRVAVPLLLALGVAVLGLGVYQALWASPPDYQQGEFVRLMYVHVPSAWLGLGMYVALALAAGVFLVWKTPMAEVMAHSIAPVGAVFTALCLVTGMMWGKPIWGAYWVWDARLTSVLVLWFLYLGYIALADAFEGSPRGGLPAAMLALVGIVNLPIIKFSVEWWNTLHQPASVFRVSGPALAPEMMAPLMLMFLGTALLSAVAVLWRAQALLMMRRVRRLKRR